MPQMYIHSPNETTRLAVWHITEPESFFTEVVTVGKNIAHPHKRLQHLGGRYLLQYLQPGFPMADVVAAQYNKPFLPGHPWHFSISHSDDYAAAIVSTTQQLGIDIETVEERVLKIRHKFLSSREEEMLVKDCNYLNDMQRMTLAWSAKETMFKWLGETEVDFKEHLLLEHVTGTASHGVIVVKLIRTRMYHLHIHYRFLKNIILTWTSV